MDRIRIVGGTAAQRRDPDLGRQERDAPLMIASLLTEDTLILENVPRLADVIQLQRILGNHGVDITIAGKRPGDDPNNGRTMHISAKHIVDTTAPYELVSKMRASFWVVAPLLARMGEAKVSMPGGCAIGTRPVDLLIMALERARRRNRDRSRLCDRARDKRAAWRRNPLSQGHRRRHPYRADGGLACQAARR